MILTLMRWKTHQCGVVEDLNLLIMSMDYQRNMSSRFSSNLEVDASDLIGNIEENVYLLFMWAMDK